LFSIVCREIFGVNLQATYSSCFSHLVMMDTRHRFMAQWGFVNTTSLPSGEVGVCLCCA